MASAEGVPVIDMQDVKGFPEQIVKACEEWGCFRLVNHGVPMKLMSEMKVVCRSLLDLPMDIKKKNIHPEFGKGYTEPNQASPVFEGLSCYDVLFPGTIDEFCTQVDATPYQREIITKYSSALDELARHLGRKIMESLGMKGELFEDWPVQLKMNKYNYSQETVGKTGAVMHTDPGFLTILQDDELINGLEAINKYTGELVPVDPVPGTLVINMGDVANVWSNGKFCNVKHRVQCYEPSIRVSIALFVLGPRNGKVETPDELVDLEHPRIYHPFNFEDYRKLRTSTKSPTGEALELFLINKP